MREKTSSRGRYGKSRNKPEKQEKISSRGTVRGKEKKKKLRNERKVLK